MAYAGQIARILVSAPGDLDEGDRRTIFDTIHTWNVRDGETHGVAFVPMHWSSDTAAEHAVRPQESINQQIVDRADVVIALFWTRLGTPTDEAESGTVEELTRAAEAGKYVAILRCTRPIDPSTIETEQLAALKGFFEAHRTSGLVKDYSDRRDLEREVSNILLLAAGRAQADSGAPTRGVATPQRPAVVWATSRSQGNAHQIVLHNRGELPAHDVTFDLQSDGDEDAPELYEDGLTVEVLPPEAPMSFGVIVYDQGSVRVTVRWFDEAAQEGAEREVREQASTVRF